MADPRSYVVGSSSLVLGCDSYTSPAELDDKEFIFGQNVTVRGGIVQTRPGSRTVFCLPDGNFQGATLFTPANGVAHLVFAVNGAVYVSPAPFESYRRLWTIQFSATSKYIAWASTLKSTEYTLGGDLYTLDNPYSVLMMQDGVTRAAYWDGSTAAHLNPAPPDDVTDVVVPGTQETPIGLWMIWSGNRLWVSRGNQIYASDIGNPLKFTESTYLNEGRAFYLSAPCTGMIEIPADTNGPKGFIAFTESSGTMFQSYIQDRAEWLNTPFFQNTILPNVGCVAPRSLVTQYGLNWWFASRGMTNMNAALRQNISSRIDYQDNEMFSSKAYLSPDLSSICASYYENYLMMSVPSGDVFNRHTWVLDQAPFEGNAPAWTGIWTGWRPIEWCRGIVNGDERVFFGSVDYDGKNRIWEAMLPERRDNGCAITCYAQLRDHAGGNLERKRYEWSKFFLSQILGDVHLNVYVASTKGAYQFQKGYQIVASEGQVFSDVQYSEAGPLMIGNRVQTRTIRTPADPDDNDCNKCGVESEVGNMIDYAFSHLLVWSGQMGIRAYQMHMRESPERDGGDCEEPETGPRTLNAQGCSGLEALVQGEVFETFEASAEGGAVTSYGTAIYIRVTRVSAISEADAQAQAECAVLQLEGRLNLTDIAPGVYGTERAEIGGGTYVIVNTENHKGDPGVVMTCESESTTASLCGYSEFASPSIPPIKYRRCDVTGYWGVCDYLSSPCVGSVNIQETMEYSGSSQYSEINCSCTPGFVRKYRNVGGGACSQPLGSLSNYDNPACDRPNNPTNAGNGDYFIDQVIETNTQTTKTWDYLNGKNPSCYPIPGAFRTWSGEVVWTLSIEDTEAAAIARASFSPGSSCMSARESRGAGQFDFFYQTSSYHLLVSNLVEGRSYVARVDLVEEDYGGGAQTVTTVSYPFIAAGETHSIDAAIPNAASGKQITVTNPRAEST